MGLGAPIFAGLAFGPVGFVIAGFSVGLGLVYAAKIAQGNSKKCRFIQKEIIEDSSEAQKKYHVGANGEYSSVLKNDRPFSRGPGNPGLKGVVEADHIPPLDCLRRAAKMPEFQTLKLKNPALYKMVKSLENDPGGRKLFTLQVYRVHHRVALSTGSSSESMAVRAVLAKKIANGKVLPMFKQAMMIAHPFVSQQIRLHAGLKEKEEEEAPCSTIRVVDNYQKGFVNFIQFYHTSGILNDAQKEELMDYVKTYGYYLDFSSSEYQEIIEAVRNAKKKK